MSIHEYGYCRCGWWLDARGKPLNQAEVERHAQLPGHAPVTRHHERRYCTDDCRQRSTGDPA